MSLAERKGCSVCINVLLIRPFSSFYSNRRTSTGDMANKSSGESLYFVGSNFIHGHRIEEEKKNNNNNNVFSFFLRFRSLFFVIVVFFIV